MNKGDKKHGFTVTEVRDIPSINSTVLLLQHDRTRARAIKIQNDDDNKAFGIAFRTPPADSTGVAHILEHCVLSGSEKYRTKEPFMDLIGGSLQTFLNAITFSDKTIYPIASRNETDYHNLMDVYLDAVFHPLVDQKEEIFRQEGWICRIDADGLSYNGIVYNEMRGAMSDAEEQILDRVNAELLKDTIYRHNSGGDPYEIPNLRYEEFLAFHKNYYHPSNSILYFYGDGDLDKELAHAQEFLQDYAYLAVDSDIAEQKPFKKPVEVAFDYHVALTDTVENKDWLGTSWLIGRSTEPQEAFMSLLLQEVLIESSASPLKKALLEAGIGEDFLSPYNDGIHRVFGILAKNTDRARKDDFSRIVEEVFRQIAEKGIDRGLLDAALNKIEFALIEGPGHSAKGVVRFIQVLGSALYDADPLEMLDFEAPFQTFRESLAKGALQSFVRERILDNPHRVDILATPKPGLFDEKDRSVKEELAARLAKMTEEEKQALREAGERLDTFRDTADTPEDKETIPHLSLADLSPKVDRIDSRPLEVEQATVLHNDVFTGRIVYADLVFDLSHLSQKELQDVSHVASFLGDVATKKRGYEDVYNAIYRVAGGLSIVPSIFEDFDTAEPLPKLVVSVKFFADRQKEAIDMVREILFESVFEDDKRLKEVLLEDRSTMDMSLISSGHAVVMSRVMSYFSKAAALREEITGLDSYFTLQEITTHFDEKKAAYKENWQKVYAKLLRRDGLIVNVTTDKETFHEGFAVWEELIREIPLLPAEPQEYERKERNKEAFLSAAGVQYVSKGASLRDLGVPYSGSLTVLAAILSIQYLHQKIRATGGAYGAGLSIQARGTLSTYSYRDPQLEKTIDVYNTLGDVTENLQLSQRELEDAIIGTINRFDPPLSPRDKGLHALSYHITGYDYAQVEKYLQEALHTRVEDLQAHADMLRKAMDKNYLCVLGSEEKIREAANLFDHIIPLDYAARNKK